MVLGFLHDFNMFFFGVVAAAAPPVEPRSVGLSLAVTLQNRCPHSFALALVGILFTYAVLVEKFPAFEHSIKFNFITCAYILQWPMFV